MTGPKKDREARDAEAEEAAQSVESDTGELSDDELESVAGGFGDVLSGAQGYASGGGVHLPSGATDHMPHEVSHVTQQKKGGG